MSQVDRIAELEAEVARLREDRGHDEGTISDLNHTVYAQTLTIENLKAENIRLSEQLEKVKALVLDDVPHKYQTRLLEVLT